MCVGTRDSMTPDSKAGWQLHRLSVAMYGLFWSCVWWVNSPFTCSGWLIIFCYINGATATPVGLLRSHLTDLISCSWWGLYGLLVRHHKNHGIPWIMVTHGAGLHPDLSYTAVIYNIICGWLTTSCNTVNGGRWFQLEGCQDIYSEWKGYYGKYISLHNVT